MAAATSRAALTKTRLLALTWAIAVIDAALLVLIAALAASFLVLVVAALPLVIFLSYMTGLIDRPRAARARNWRRARGWTRIAAA